MFHIIFHLTDVRCSKEIENLIKENCRVVNLLESDRTKLGLGFLKED